MAEPSHDGSSFDLISRLGRRLAHELNNPISAIASSAYLIQDMIETGNGHLDATEIEPFIKSIQEECEALKATIEEYTKFVSTSSILINKLDLAEFVQKRSEEMAREGLPVTASVPHENRFVQADAAGLGFVLRTLADSATQAGATNVTLMLESNGQHEILIKDNRASTLSSGELLSLFSTDELSKSSGRPKGLGLKLPLAKRIIALHGGSLEIPEPKDGTTEIRISLPRSE
jgi:signal transduction histidine kinase